jgi:hypothetical protein
LVDLFEEVEEQLRSDRYNTLARQAAPWVTGIFAVVLLGYFAYWGFTIYQNRNLAAATAAYQKGVDALAQNDQTGAFAAFEASAKAGAPAYKALSLMQEGDLRQAAGKGEEAAKLFDAAAAASPNQIFADLNRLKAAEAVLDTAPYAQLRARLLPLVDTKRPYWIFAKEALAMAELMAGQTTQARADFNILSLTLGAPEDMRRRDQMAMALIDAGEAPTAIAAVKAAATLPPSPPDNVAASPPGAEGQGEPPQSPAGAAQ